MAKSKRSRSSQAQSHQQDKSLSHHESRKEVRKRVRTEKQAVRTATLAHDTREKKDAFRLKLHLTQTQRQIALLRARLEAWDEQEEAEKAKKEQERRLQEEELDKEAVRKKRKLPPGPETWRLKGAARPAWEIYDFDTRYVDPHIEAHKRAQEKAQRYQNLLAVYRGKMGQAGLPDICREYLGLLMQWGHLSQEAKQYKTAREAWLECINLEGNDHPITTARESLMRMYLDLNRPKDVLQLGKLCAEETSVWIRYSVALVAYQQGKKEEVELHMVRCIRSNIFCAYYIGFYDTFSKVMEYTDDIEDADDEPQTSLEEAIEYCSSRYVKVWHSSGAFKVLRELVLRASKGEDCGLTSDDLDWKGKLEKIEKELTSRSEADEDDRDDDDDDESKEGKAIDVTMFVGMFSTAMEMLREGGELR